MDEMTQVPQTPENAQQLDQSPIGAPPEKPVGAIKKILNTTSWLIFFTLLPIATLILLSQNSIPGDLFYPIKRGMEGVVLAAASVSPATRAAFRTDLTTRRFDEAEKLLLTNSDIKGLKDFVAEIQAAQTEVSAISDPTKKQKLQQKIQTSVIEYEKRLNEVKAQLATREQATSPTPPNTSVPVPTSKAGQLSIPTPTPIPLPTSTTQSPNPSKQPTATPTIEATILTTLTPTPVPATNTPTKTSTATPVPTLTPTPTPPQSGGEGTIGTVDKVQEYLHCLQTTPAPHSECIPPEIDSASFNSEDQSGSQNEGKSKRDEKQEEKKGKNENKK